jgi:hypothetical protein
MLSQNCSFSIIRSNSPAGFSQTFSTPDFLYSGPFAAGPFEVGPFEVGPFEVGPFEGGPFVSGPFQAGPLEAGRFVGVPFCKVIPKTQ